MIRVVLCPKDDRGRVELTPPDDGPNLGDLRANVLRFCRRVGITDPKDVDRVHAKWRARADRGRDRHPTPDAGQQA